MFKNVSSLLIFICLLISNIAISQGCETDAGAISGPVSIDGCGGTINIDNSSIPSGGTYEYVFVYWFGSAGGATSEVPSGSPSTSISLSMAQMAGHSQVSVRRCLRQVGTNCIMAETRPVNINITTCCPINDFPISGSSSVSVGGSGSYSISTESGVTYEWFQNTTSLGTGSSQSISFPDEGSSAIRVVATGPTCTKTETLYVSVTCLPSAGVSVTGLIECDINAQTVTVTANGGDSYVWTFPPDVMTTGSGATITADIPAGPGARSSYVDITSGGLTCRKYFNLKTIDCASAGCQGLFNPSFDFLIDCSGALMNSNGTNTNIKISNSTGGEFTEYFFQWYDYDGNVIGSLDGLPYITTGSNGYYVNDLFMPDVGGQEYVSVTLTATSNVTGYCGNTSNYAWITDWFAPSDFNLSEIYAPPCGNYPGQLRVTIGQAGCMSNGTINVKYYDSGGSEITTIIQTGVAANQDGNTGKTYYYIDIPSGSYSYDIFLVNDRGIQFAPTGGQFGAGTAGGTNQYPFRTFNIPQTSVADFPDIEIAVAPQFICSADEFTVEAPVGFDYYNWYVGSAPSGAGIAPDLTALSGAGAHTLTPFGPGLYQIALTAGDAAGCAAHEYVQVQVADCSCSFPEPDLNITSGCNPIASLLNQASMPAGSLYSWYLYNDDTGEIVSTLSGEGPFTLLGLSNFTTYRMQVIVTDPTDCTNIVVETFSTSNVAVAGTDFSVCEPETIATITDFSPPNGSWSAVASNPTTASITNAGSVTGMTVNGVYEFVYTLSSCTDTIEITRGCNCSMDVVSATTPDCNGVTDTYSVDVTLSYFNEPTGDITVTTDQGASVTVAQSGSPQVVTLSGLAPNGATGVAVTAIFVDESSCTGTLASAFDAPTTCITASCSSSVTATPGTCDSGTNQYTLTGSVTFTNEPTSGTLTVSDGAGGNEVFNAPFTSPQAYSITGISSDGASHTVTAVFSADDPDCTSTVDYTAPANCAPGVCSSSVTATPGTCNTSDNLYSLNGSITFSDPPSTGTMTVSVAGGGDQVFNLPATTSPAAYSISGLTSDGASHTVTVVFSADSGCGSTVNYTAPVSCMTSTCTSTFKVSASACSPATNQYSVAGRISYSVTPTSGTLTISDSGGGSQVFNFPGTTSPTDIVISGINSDGATHTLTAVFSDNSGCNTSTTYTAPAACSAPCAAGSPTVTGAERCGSGDVTLMAASGANCDEIRWYTALTGGSSVNIGTSYTVSLTSTTSYYVSCYNTSGDCESDPRQEVVGTVNAVPTIVANAACDAGNATYAITVITTVADGLSSTSGTVAGSAPNFTVSGINVGTDVTLTATNSTTTCSSMESVTSPICSASCSITGFTSVATDCYPLALTFDIEGEVSFNNGPSTGTLTIDAGNGYTAVINMPATSPVSYTILGLPTNGSLITVFPVFSDDATCGQFANTIVSPDGCVENCNAYVAIEPSPCDPTTGFYNLEGFIYTTNGPNNGTITATMDGQTDVINLPAFASHNFSFSDQLSDGLVHNISIAFSDDSNCDGTYSFTAPGACSEENCDLSINSVSPQDETCGDNTGEATVNTTYTGGGVLDYIWDPVVTESGNMATGLGAGTYNVTVTAGTVNTINTCNLDADIVIPYVGAYSNFSKLLGIDFVIPYPPYDDLNYIKYSLENEFGGDWTVGFDGNNLTIGFVGAQNVPSTSTYQVCGSYTGLETICDEGNIIVTQTCTDTEVGCFDTSSVTITNNTDNCTVCPDVICFPTVIMQN